MKNRVYTIGILIIMLIPVMIQAKIAILNNKEDSINILTNSDWHDSWYDNSTTGANIKREKDLFVIKGTSKKKSYGSVYNDIRIDFDKYPILEVDASKVKGRWYILIADQSLTGGYIHIQRDTFMRGKFRYDLQKITGFRRKRTVQLQVGITSGSTKPNKDLFVKLKSLKLHRVYEKRDIPENDNFSVYTPEIKKNLKGWEDKYKDGASTGATISFQGKKGTVRGTSKKMNYGFAYRDVELNLDKYPILQIDVDGVSEGWYLIIHSKEIPAGYVKLDRYNNQTGVYEYDIKAKTKLSGKQRFWLSLGVVVERGGINKNFDQTVTFNHIKFLNKKKLKNFSEQKKEKKDTIIEEIDINAISLRNRFFLPEHFKRAIVGIKYSKRKIKSIDVDMHQDKIYFHDAKKIFNELAYRNDSFLPKRDNFKFFDENKMIGFKNDAHKIIYHKKNGSLIRIVNLKVNKEILSSNNTKLLWKMDLRDGTSVYSKDMVFNYTHLSDNSLEMNFTDEKTGSVVKIRCLPSEGIYIDYIISIGNKFDQDIINFSFPETLVFQYRQLNQFIFPFKLGLALNKNFYSQKKQLMDKYPNLFADFASIQLRNGMISIYGIQDPTEIFLPANLETGYTHIKGGTGYFTHKYIVYVKKGQEFTLPTIRMNFNNNVKNVIKDYKIKNNITEYPDVKEKCGEELYKKIKNSVLLKVEVSKNRDFNYIKSFTKYLSAPTMVHLVTYWYGGFDRNYPDYLPPDEAFGSLEDMADMCKEISDSGNIVMPYTNPTWWHENSATMNKLKKNQVTLKNLNGELITEGYNRSTGFLVNPYHPGVINRINRTVEEFTDDVPVDILFEDQLGARKWFYGSNQELPSLVAYVQGIINIAKRNHKQIPLFTEEGFDRLIPYESGFCNMSAANHSPPDDNYNVRFGKNNWSIFPLALYLAHDKVGFYQHNLAEEVFSDSIKKITWNLVYGHNLYIGRWVSSWPKQVKEYQIADTIQKEIVSKYFDKKLTHYYEIDDNVFCSQYENMIVVGNLSEEAYKIGKYTIAKDGFLVMNKQGTLFAGVFSSFNGSVLGGDRMILLKRRKNKILIKQLAAENSFITIPRPSSWKFDRSIEAYYDNKKIPFVSDKKGITLYLEYDQDEKWYELRYNRNKQTAYDLRIKTRREENKVNFNIELLCFRNMEKVGLGISSYIVRSIGGVPSLNSSKDDFKSKIIKKINIDNKLVFDFKLPIPKYARMDDSIWLNINLYEDGKKIKQNSGIVRLAEVYDMILKRKKVTFIPEEKKYVTLTVYNYSHKSRKGKIKIKYPPGFKGKKSIPFIINKNSKKDIKVRIQSASDVKKGDYFASFDMIINSKTYTSAKLKLVSLSKTYYVDVNPVNNLVLNKKNQLTVTIKDLPGDFKKCHIYIKVPSKWQIEDFKNGLEHDFSLNNYKSISFTIIPKIIKEEYIHIKVVNGKKTITYKEKFKGFAESSTSLLIADVNNDKVKDIILANNKLEVLITPIMGARILKIINRETGHNQLFTDYPGIEQTKGSTWESWAEYGGLNDWWPTGWPGHVWNNKWNYRILTKKKSKIEVEFSSKDHENKMTIKRKISLRKNKNYAGFSYNFKNLSDTDINFFYNSHPDFAPGKDEYADSSDYALVPVLKDNKKIIIEKPFIKSLSKQNFSPVENWCLALDKKSNEYIGQVFQKEKIDQIGVWQGVNFYSMELLSTDFKLKAKSSMKMQYYLFVGQNNWKKDIKQIQKEVRLSSINP